MSQLITMPYAVMEGEGAYNRNSKKQISGATLAIPFLEEAARNISVAPEGEPLIVADYGSSQGKNSFLPIEIAIENLRPRMMPNRSILVVHIDQASNDFNTLFEILHSDPGRYAFNDPNVFSCAVGKSFYEQVLPANSVHLGWCSFAALWLSRTPTTIPGHFFPYFTSGSVRDAFERQAAEDWEKFLSLRAREMCPGARLVLVLPTIADAKFLGFLHLVDHANTVLGEMVEDGLITAEERAGMVVASYARQRDELLAPFHGDGAFHGLTVEEFETAPLPDPAWIDYEVDGDRQVLATKQALFFRAAFMPSLASALGRVRAGDRSAMISFADALQHRLICRLVIYPTSADFSVQILVLTKSA